MADQEKWARAATARARDATTRAVQRGSVAVGCCLTELKTRRQVGSRALSSA